VNNSNRYNTSASSPQSPYSYPGNQTNTRGPQPPFPYQLVQDSHGGQQPPSYLRWHRKNMAAQAQPNYNLSYSQYPREPTQQQLSPGQGRYPYPYTGTNNNYVNTNNLPYYANTTQPFVFDIWQAAGNGESEKIKYWLEHGGDANLAHVHDGYTPLHWAASAGQSDVVLLLLTKGADVNNRSKEGWTPLLLAVKNKHFKATRLLVEHGALIESKDRDGRDAMAWAEQDDTKDIFNYLKEMKVIQRGIASPSPLNLSETKKPVLENTNVTTEKSEAQITLSKSKDKETELGIEWVKENVADDFTCPLCLELLFVPCTTRCGHTFCKICLEDLLKTEQYKNYCPVCRASLNIDLSKEELHVNLILVNLLKKIVPEMYKNRAAQEEQAALEL